MIYFIVLFFLLFFSIRILFPYRNNTYKALLFVSSIVLILFAGFRGNIEPDYINYKGIFDRSTFESLISLDVEIGYYILNKIIFFFGLQFQWVLFFMAFLSIGVKIIFFKNNSPNFLFSLLLFYCSVFFLYDFIAIRQALALSFFFLAIPYLFKRNLIKYFVTILLASTIHVSAILLLPLYFFLNLNYPSILLYLVVFFCYYLNYFEIKVHFLNNFSSIISLPTNTIDKLDIYSLEEEFASVSNKQFLFALIFIFYKNKLSNYRRASLYINIFVFGILIATLFNEIPQFAYRSKAYFLWTDVLLVVMIIHNVAKKSMIIKIVLYLIVAIIYGFTMSKFLESVASRGNYIFPYKTFFYPVY